MDDELTRVVLADDVPEFRRIIRLMLERRGRFEVVGEADSGDQDPSDLGGAAGLGVERIVKKCSPSTSVVRAVTGAAAAYRTEEES